MRLKFLALIVTVIAISVSCNKSSDSSGGGGTTPTTASITALNCPTVTFNAVATAGVAYSATVTVPYSGGNAVAYLAGSSIVSTGVTGLTATLIAGTLANGTGNLSFTVAGTPSAAGIANFPVTFGGQTCSFALTVNAAGPTLPTISALACASGSFSATATVAVAYTATATVPYNGGNGIAYSAGTAITSTGVTGLTATLMAGTLASGTGNLTYNVTGTPSAVGTANFAISFGGQSCSLALPVNSAGGGPTLPSVYSKIYGATSITFDGTWVTIKCNALPDHKSAYYPTTNPLYEAFSGTTFGGGMFAQNPNTIATQSITMKIPVNPVVAATHAAPPGGVIGIALNGVPF